MPYQASVDYELQGGEISEVYSSNIVDPSGRKEIDSEVKNSNGQVIGHTLRNKFPDANADYSNKQVGAGRLMNSIGYNPYFKSAKKESLAPEPYKEEDVQITQMRLNHRNTGNAIRNNVQMNKNGVTFGDKIMDSGRPEYNMGGQDRREISQRVYSTPSLRKSGIENPREIQPNTHVNPVSYQSKLGALRVGDKQNVKAKETLRSAEDATGMNRFTSLRVPTVNSKRAQASRNDHMVGYDVTTEGQKINTYKNELVENRQYDVTYLPTMRNVDEHPVQGTFNVRNSQHERIDNLPPEYDYANIDRRNARQSQAPGMMNYESGEQRPLPNRADMEYNPTTFIKRSELEKANPVGINDQKTQKKSVGPRSYQFEAIVFDRAPGTIVDNGMDDGTHNVINGPANVDNMSKRKVNRFNYDVQQSVGGRKLIVPAATIGKQETWRRNVYDEKAQLNRPTPPTYTNMVVGPQ